MLCDSKKQVAEEDDDAKDDKDEEDDQHNDEDDSRNDDSDEENDEKDEEDLVCVCIMVSVWAAVKQCDDCFNWYHRECLEDTRDETKHGEDHRNAFLFLLLLFTSFKCGATKTNKGYSIF